MTTTAENNWRAESEKWRAEADKRAAEAAARHDKEMAQIREGLAQTRAIVDANAKALAKTDERLDKVAKSLELFDTERGNEGKRRGDVFERAVFKSLEKAKKLGEIRLDVVRPNVKPNKDGYEFDIVGLNGDSTTVMELKYTLSVEDVRHFAEGRLPFFAELLPEYSKGKKIIGAMIFERTDPRNEAVKEALKHGLLVFCADNAKNLTPIKTPADMKEHHRLKK